MFLNELNNEEKKAFLCLSVHAANANGVFEDEERAMMEEYCKEMGIAFFDTKNTQPLEEIMDIFQKSSKRVKKIVLLEILGLLYSDETYDDDEKKFVAEYGLKVGVSQEEIDMITFHIKRYLDVVNDIAIELSNE